MSSNVKDSPLRITDNQNFNGICFEDNPYDEESTQSSVSSNSKRTLRPQNQKSFDEDDIENCGIDFLYPDNPNTEDPLNQEPSEFDRLIQQVYYHPKCQYFYVLLLGTCLILILTYVVDGYEVAKSPAFIFVEFSLNVAIGIDFGCRIRMIGLMKYLSQNKCWNKFDFLIVVLCNVLFLLSLVFHVTSQEISEELILIAWSIAQSFRMLLIAKKQRQSIRQARSLIDFNNVELGDADALDIKSSGDEEESYQQQETPSILQKRKSNVGQLRSSSSASLSGSQFSQSKLTSMGERQKSLNRLRQQRPSEQATDYSSLSSC